MKVLVTGARGFIGRNLVANLENVRDHKDRTRNVEIDEIFAYDVDTEKQLLDRYCGECDFVFNLAGVNRPKDVAEFNVNHSFLGELLETLKKHGNKCPVMLSSSTQALLDNDYGKSKKEAEELLLNYGKENNARTLVYRFPNVFGKWCRPNYNSAVATFCNNIANDLPIQVNNRETELTLVYIDDIVDEMFAALRGQEHREGEICSVPVTHKAKLGEITDLLYQFNEQTSTLMMPEIPSGSFAKKLYSTLLSYLPERKVKFALKGNEDERGSFTEFLKTESHGQFSINVSNPGITKGQHWHNSKWEFFLVVSGHALIQERKIGTEEIMEFEVSGDKLEPVHMLPGYTHNIINLSETEKLVTVMWANELFDKDRPDTFYEEVQI
ncbi:MAG: NAD-dependent epimerase/dehydratase family protein [Erysipelotrichaceae bacterium]|nr:NAD-dependent epimerase/dehydratase family protein [Erysipelotrichaceae bacterium]